MTRFLLASVVLLVGGWRSWAADAPAAVHQVELRGHTFTLPIGFEIELAAGPPLVDRPIVADFDEQGRLYVADSSGSNEKVDIQLQKKPHRILRLEDSDGDGRFDRVTVFADKIMFPEGVLWHAGSLYVSAPPSIWKLTDADGDGVAEQRSEWFQGKTLTGCANDLHGPYLGPDGWIYWCKGAFAKQTYDRPGRPPFVTRASHIFRARPDGTGIEPVMTGGMDNPVDVVFTPGGERIFTTTFLQRPGNGLRDGLIHAVYGGVYGKDHDVVYEHPWTSPALMPPLVHLGAAAPCGMTRYESRAFGADYQDNLFACNFNMQKITRHVLEPSGASFAARTTDFLVSSNRDFHPTDVLEDADGSLLVIDTGGWYKLCCPTSQLHKPDILGGIYRVRRTGAPRIDDPRGRKLSWATMSPADLAGRLDDPRPAVRRRAIQIVAKQGLAALPALSDTIRSGRSVESRRNAVWAATRIDDDQARPLARQALADADETVRQAALHAISVRRDRPSGPALIEMLKSASPHNRRAAAEALGRIGDRSAVPALLAAVGQPADRALEHSLTYALLEIGDRSATQAGLASANGRIRRAALIALDQMTGGGIEAGAIAKDLASSDPLLKEAAVWIAGRHPEWGQQLAGFLRARLDDNTLSPGERDELVLQLAKFARAVPIQELLADRLRDAKTPIAIRLVALRTMAQSGLKEVPEKWVGALTQILADGDAILLPEAVAAARSLADPKAKSPKLNEPLLALSARGDQPAALRLNALAAVPGNLASLTTESFALLRAHLDRDQPVALRNAAADVLGRSKLTAEQLAALAEALKTTGPLELDRLLDAFAQSTDDRVGQSLLAALKASPLRSSLRVDQVKTRLAKYSPSVKQQAEELYAAIDTDAGKQKSKLEQLLSGLKDGDIRRGQAVFHSQKAACFSCHAVGYLGGNIGPDLTRIGQIRSDRDLLESIVFPNASFVRSYEPVVVATKDGKLHNGIVRRESADEIVLALNATQEVRVLRAEIEEMLPSKISIMPAGLEQQLTPRELADLVAFLRACR